MACGVVQLHPSVDYLFPNPELWKCWTFYRVWHPFVMLFYFNPYRNINELRKILPFFHLQNLMSEGLKEGLLSILCWNNIWSQTPWNIYFLSFAGSSSTVSKTVSGLHETMFRIRNFFSLYFDSVKMMEFILLYEANIPLKKPTCIWKMFLLPSPWGFSWKILSI